MPTPILVTFAIATHNRGPVILECLHRTLNNSLPQSQFEIIIIDNASTDATPDLIAAEFPNHPRLRLIRLNSNCGPVAKNIAIRKAKGEFIVLLDDDAFPHPGAIPQMVRHFRDNKNLAAAVFDITLPDGSKEASAYPDIFIGAGTGLRRSALEHVAALESQKAAPANHLVTPPPCHRATPSRALLPASFFMQAEEYDLSFRLLDAGFSIQRFWDLPLTHLKSPSARIGQRTTALDIRNNLYLLARYIPQPLAHQFAADWMSRYWMMAETRDEAANDIPHSVFGTHREAYIRGAEEGLARWTARRAGGRRLLAESTIERIFKFHQVRRRMEHAVRRTNARKILFADLGKNMLAYWLAAKDLNLEILAIADDRLALPLSQKPRDYRGIPLLAESPSTTDDAPTDTPNPWHAACDEADLVIVSNMSPVQAPRRTAALRRTLRIPVVDLFSRQDTLMQHLSPAPS